MKPVIVGVMGGASVDNEVLDDAYRLGAFIAAKGWILLNGGRNRGVMDWSAKGAFENGGYTIGILPGENKDNLSSYIKFPIVTAMGSARNIINVLSSSVIVALKGGAGTISEIALALKHHKIVICKGMETGALFSFYEKNEMLYSASSVIDIIDTIDHLISNGRIDD